ncbi:MAG: hypothetical protein HY825_15640 [Acidobacteria bacterium]|nr:hypothetical protein [Acidobacteriota bacterium]
MAIDVKVRGIACRTTVAQRYENVEAVPIEAVYTFPLEEGAAVCGFEVEIGGKRIVGGGSGAREGVREVRRRPDPGPRRLPARPGSPEHLHRRTKCTSRNELPPRSGISRSNTGGSPARTATGRNSAGGTRRRTGASARRLWQPVAGADGVTALGTWRPRRRRPECRATERRSRPPDLPGSPSASPGCRPPPRRGASPPPGRSGTRGETGRGR